MNNKKCLILFLLIFNKSISAGSEVYDCVIKHVYNLSDNGLLITSNWQNNFVDGKFIVSKKTGAIEGKTLTTINANETRVINSGSNEYSFKAIASFKNQFQLIEIQEFKPSKNKPFIASSMGGSGIVTGMCK